ncbi:MAG TPA: ankyrin repeat domain-containing protein, partial [Parachlamydiaceae bacterium]|nr:hypothetical protein [Nitrosopumilus sp.]HEV8052834.1 ankyrin repeat domain-containing protein [Parachlamydiaceae bacterium]
MSINTNSYKDYKHAWNQIVCLPEKELFKLTASKRESLFNDAIPYLNDCYGRLIKTPPSLIGKFIRCIPSECTKNPEFQKLDSLIHANVTFYEDSIWNFLPFQKTAKSELAIALEEDIISGNETGAIALLEHALPFTPDTLLLACRHNRITVAMYLIEKGFIAEMMTHSQKRHFFQIAIEQKQFELINALIKVAPEMKELMDAIMLEELRTLIMTQDEETIIALIVEGAPFILNSRILFLAWSKGFFGLVRCLINKDNNINVTDSNGHSLLYIACQNNYPELISELVQQGANFTYHERHNLKRNDLSNFDENLRFELAKSCLKTDSGMLDKIFSIFDIRDEKFVLDLFKLESFDVFRITKAIKKLEIANNQKLLINIAENCAKRNGSDTFRSFDDFGIKDDTSASRIKKLCFIKVGIDIFKIGRADFINSREVYNDIKKQLYEKFPFKFDKEWEKLINLCGSQINYKKIPAELLKNFIEITESYDLVKKLHEVDALQDNDVALNKIHLMLEILFCSSLSLGKNEASARQKGFVNEIFTFGRSDLINPLYRKTIISWNEPNYIKVSQSMPDFDLPWKYTFRELLIDLVVKGMDQPNLLKIVKEIEKIRDFKDGKNVQIFIDMLIQLSSDDRLTSSEIQDVLLRFLEEAQMSAYQM